MNLTISLCLTATSYMFLILQLSDNDHVTCVGFPFRIPNSIVFIYTSLITFSTIKNEIISAFQVFSFALQPIFTTI